MKSHRPVAETHNPRRHERRHCRHYYGDGGCLDLAARDDLRAVPCRRCKLFARPNKEDQLRRTAAH